MCNDHGPTRRDVLYGGAVLAAAAVLARRGARPGQPILRQVRRAAGPISYGGATAYSMAMHIHSSFSEQSGSMDGQLNQAMQNLVDVVWWTDHDHRMDGFNYRDVVHFTSATEAGAAGQGGSWNWVTKHSTGLKSGWAAAFVQSPYSPNDPVAGGSVYLTAAAKSGVASAWAGLYADTKPAGWNIRDNLAGQSLAIDVLLAAGWSRGYLELAIQTSAHPSGGQYSLSYRMVPGAGPVTRAAQGSLGVVTIPVGNSWQTVTVTPEQDIAAIWPAVDPRDFALWNLQLNAVSTGGAVSGYFDYLQFDRTLTGGELCTQQQSMMQALAGVYPGVTQQQGLEVSAFQPHLNWFGPNIAVPGYQGMTSKKYPGYLSGTVVPEIHSAGGLASYNHPYGYGDIGEYPQSTQDTMLQQTATKLLGNKVIGCDLLEVGYNLRQGVDLAHHVGLWDVMSRNAVFLTGNGTSDDHFGVNWAGLRNNWITSAWAPSTGQADLLAALAAGRAWCGAIGYAGALDMLVDGSAPMGSVSVSGVSSRNLVLTATGIPAGGSVQVVQGTVDYAGTSAPTPDTSVVAAWTDADLAAGGGQVSTAIGTTAESFIRPQVLDAAGNVIAIGNPAWLLHNTPPGGIPAPRQA
jgi:hypothetical protein